MSRQPHFPSDADRRSGGAAKTGKIGAQYEFGDVSKIVETARRSATRSVNSIMTVAYWLIGRRVVEFEQSGKKRAEYGTALIERLSNDLTAKFGRGFGTVNLSQMKKFYLLWPPEQIFQMLSEKLRTLPVLEDSQAILQTPSEKSQTLSAESLLDKAEKDWW